MYVFIFSFIKIKTPLTIFTTFNSYININLIFNLSNEKISFKNTKILRNMPHIYTLIYIIINKTIFYTFFNNQIFWI